MSQKSIIKRHLEAGGTLTPRQADKLCGCLRLSARVHELNREYAGSGKQIRCRLIPVINRAGMRARVARYHLEVENE